MDGKHEGFTLIEILVVVTIIGVLAGLVVVLIPRGQFEAQKVDCINNVKNITGLLQSTNPQRYPNHSGPNLILYLVNKRELVGKDSLKLLFCPADAKESLDGAGGVDAYKDVDLGKREYGGLTSYAGRDQLNSECAAKKGAAEAHVLVCDDSEDHHDGKGFVVGLTNGAVKWRDKFDDYGQRQDAPVEVGEGSPVEELVCLRAE